MRNARRSVADLAAYGLALTSLAAVVVHSASGHAAAGRWPVAANVSFQAVHTAAIGAWLGGLAVLLAGVGGAPSEIKTAAVARFSHVAAGGLVVVLITGVVRGASELA